MKDGKEKTTRTDAELDELAKLNALNTLIIGSASVVEKQLAWLDAEADKKPRTRRSYKKSQSIRMIAGNPEIGVVFTFLQYLKED